MDSFETRKAAILHKAFTGELTAKWREEHGISIDNWKTTRFDSVAAIRSNLVDPAEYQSFPHIAPDNIEKKTGVLLEYHTIAEDGVTSGKHRFYSGQILYSKIRPYLSKAVVVDFDGLCSADMYPIEAYQNARCLWYYMLSDEFLLQASTAGSRSVLPKMAPAHRGQRRLLIATAPPNAFQRITPAPLGKPRGAFFNSIRQAFGKFLVSWAGLLKTRPAACRRPPTAQSALRPWESPAS